MKRSGIELLHGWTQPKRTPPEKQGSLLPWIPCFFFLYTAQPYSEMEQSGIELLHGWESPLPLSPTSKAQPYSEMEQSKIELLHGWTQPKKTQPPSVSGPAPPAHTSV